MAPNTYNNADFTLHIKQDQYHSQICVVFDARHTCMVWHVLQRDVCLSICLSVTLFVW